MEEELFVLEVIDMASPMGFSTTVERSDGTYGSGDAAIHVEDRFLVAMCKGMKVCACPAKHTTPIYVLLYMYT